MTYFALFSRVGDEKFRLDTRVYLNGAPSCPDAGRCVAAVIGKNPGSASCSVYGRWRPVVLGKDKLLPYIRNRFNAAYELIGRKPPRDSYVQVWNLFYLCNEKLHRACKAVECISNPLVCDTESRRPPITWFVWGGPDHRLAAYKLRFQRRRFRNAFYFDWFSQRIVCGIPTAENFAKHTQGLPTRPIEQHLAGLL